MRLALVLFCFITNIFALDFQAKGQELYKHLEEYDKKYKISETKQWRQISGWHLWLFGYSANNQDPRGYATKKGLQNPREDFIDFAMEFIHPKVTTVRDSVKCRTPLKYKFMKDLFTEFRSPLEQEDIICDSVDKGFLNDLIFTSPIDGEVIDFGDINEDTVEGFELLYATPGTGDASEIAGHLLLRIKLNNNPMAKALNIQNPNDIVVSFLANTRDFNEGEEGEQKEIQKECKKNYFNIVDNNNNFNALSSIYQSLKGLAGGFLTMMDRQTLAQTIKHYTIEEDRNLLRFELILSKKQKKDLIDHLFKSIKNYNARYYFFTQNCASVLVKIVAQGIGLKEISEFEPITSAPNTLVAMFTRLGFARPVYPSFYSYRKKAYMAQDFLENYYKDLQTIYPKLNWPKISLILNKDVDKRIQFIKELEQFYYQNLALKDQLYKLANLIQTAEMAYEHKDLFCQNYTPKSTSQIRDLQQKLLSKINNPMALALPPINLEYEDFEKQEYQDGVSHTQLLSFGFGVGENNKNKILHLEGSVVKQDMGSLSNIAMQRGNSVELGQLELNFMEEGGVSNWKFTALNIKKLKERLDVIPSFFSYSGEFGLGLNVLDYRGNEDLNYMEGSIIGGELLYNLMASKSQEDYLYFSLGSQYAYQKYQGQSAQGVKFPIYFQNMFSFGDKRKVQWQNRFTYSYALENKMDDRKSIFSELRYKLDFDDDILYLLKLNYKKYFASSTLPEDETLWIGLEINRW